MKSIELIGAPVDCAGPKAGCHLGPTALREAGLPDRLATLGYTVRDAGDLIARPIMSVACSNPSITRLAECAGWVQHLQHAARQLDPDSVIPVFLGGDHLMASGTIPPLCDAARAAGQPLFVLWLDAHTDFHTLDSTRSGNLHGTPAAYVCGQPGFAAVFPTLNAALEPANLCQLGVRSVDDAEQRELSALPASVVTMSALRRDGVVAALRPFLDRVRASNGRLHLSFDVDCLDPLIAPGVGTAVTGGINLPEAIEIMRMVRDSRALCSVDIAELNPVLDPSGRTARIMVELMSALFAKPEQARRESDHLYGVKHAEQTLPIVKPDPHCDRAAYAGTDCRCRTRAFHSATYRFH